MKTKSIKIILSAAIVLFLGGCGSNTIPTFSLQNAFIQLQDTSYSIAENTGSEFFVTCLLASAPAQSDIDVTFKINSEKYGESAAIEGKDFEIIYPASKNLRISRDKNTASITFVTIDNNEFTEDKYFDVELVANSDSLPMNIDQKYRARVRITDDEHPLNIILGTYTQTDSLYDEDGINGPYKTVINPVKGSINSVSIHSFWNNEDYDVIANVDTKNQSITIMPYQVVGAYIQESDTIDITAVRFDQLKDEFDFDSSINGRYNAEGNITFESWGALVPEGYISKFKTSYLTR